MYKIIGAIQDNLYEEVFNSDDPFIVDIREKRDRILGEIFRKDYVHINQLVNKGITMIILRAEVRGLMRLRGILAKCQEFLREVIIIYDNEEQYNYIRSLIWVNY